MGALVSPAVTCGHGVGNLSRWLGFVSLAPTEVTVLCSQP